MGAAVTDGVASDGPGTVGVIGAGVMGCGLAEALIATGHRVVLHDVAAAVLDQARNRIRKSLLSAALLAPNGREKPSAMMARLVLTDDLERLAEADFVIENITERWDAKAALYPRLEGICRPEAVLAANSSTIPTGDFAGLLSSGRRVIGMHFMNPVPAKRLVEVIPGPETAPETIATAARLLRQMGKEMILVRDGAGFVTNRVLMLTVNEAICVVEEGVATAADVDRLFCGCFGHAMGPLATADLIGLDTILLSLESLQQRRDPRKFEPAPLLRRMVAEGRLGRKSGRGFHDYAG